MNRAHATLVDGIEASGKELADTLSRLPPETLNAAPAAGEWSIHAVSSHVRDTEEQVFLLRLRRMLEAATPPQVENFDQEQWNREHYDPAEPLHQILARFRSARRKEVALLRRTPDKEWSRTAIHPEYGNISIEWLALHCYNHTLDHLHQVLQLREKELLRALNP